MKAVVVYESLWGNTKAVARVVADGTGPGTPTLASKAGPPSGSGGGSPHQQEVVP